MATPDAHPLASADADPPALPATVARQALDWLLKVQAGEASEADWQRWRAAHPDHERAWQRIEAVNRRFQPLRTDNATDLAHATLAAPALMIALFALAVNLLTDQIQELGLF